MSGMWAAHAHAERGKGMNGTLFKEVNYSLAKLAQDIEIGEIGLPDIQRPFVWPNTKVRDLFDSMYKGFPVGYLLFWAHGGRNGHRQIGANSKQKIPRLLIVDGQQRLTSLYAVLKGIPVLRDNFRQEHISIAFSPRDQKFQVADAAIRRDPEYIPDISKLWSGELARNRFVKEFVRELREHRPVTESEEDGISDSIDALYDLLNYPFTALELSPDVNEEQVAEVFVRVNSKGTPLNQADFILTLMSVFWDEGRAQLEKFCRDARTPTAESASPYNHLIQPDPDQMLRVGVGLGFHRARLQNVYSILRGKDLDTEEFSDERRKQQFEVLKGSQGFALNLQHWHDYLKTILRAGYLRSDMITSKTGVLYAYALFLIGKHRFMLDDHMLRNVMARWFFMTALTGRYSGSPETVMEQDLNRVKDAKNGEEFISALNGVVSSTFTEDFWNVTLPNELATASPRSPSLFAYFAALNLLEAKVLFSNLKVSDLLNPSLRANRSALERHHLFPKGHLSTLGITEIRETNQIANYALVEWMDNDDISDEAPASYLLRYESRLSPEDRRNMWYWHGLPEGWQNMKYQDFLPERRKLIAKVIRDGFEKLAK